MQYKVIDLGNQPAHTSVRIDISGTEANIRLLDAANYARYRRGDSHRTIGGHYTRSPALLTTSHTGHWYVVGDLGGYAGLLGITATISERSVA